MIVDNNGNSYIQMNPNMEYIALKDVIVEENVLFKAGNTYYGDGVDLVGEGGATMRFKSISQIRRTFKVQRKGLDNIREYNVAEVLQLIGNVELHLDALKEKIANESTLRRLVLNENNVELVARFKDGEETIPPRAKHDIIGKIYSDIQNEYRTDLGLFVQNTITALQNLIANYDA